MRYPAIGEAARTGAKIDPGEFMERAK